MAIIKCPECGHNVSDNAQFCPGCGIKIANNLKKCPDCDEILLMSTSTCPKCGHQFSATGETSANTPQDETDIQEEEVLAYTAPQNNQPRKSHTVRNVLLIIVAIILVGGGVFGYFAWNEKTSEETMEQAYKALEGSTNPDDYQAFLDSFPDSKFQNEVETKLNKLKAENDAWMSISLSSSKNDFIQFMNRFPGSRFEARCQQKIDSLDWIDAKSINTPDAIQRYIEEHPNGLYVDEARDMEKNMAELTVQPEERAVVANLCHIFFTALGANDQEGVCSVISPEMKAFLSTPNATKADVITAMEAMHPATITSINFVVNNDYVITKQMDADNQVSYNVAYSVDQHIARTDEGKTFASYKVIMEVDPQFKINSVQIKEISSH